MVVGRQLEQHGVEVDRLSHALEHGAAKIVVEKDPGHALEGFEGACVAADEARHVGAEGEAEKDLARVAEHHDEAHQRARGAADLKLAEVPPVDLRLLVMESFP
jgi:hypothetical protein